MKKDTKIAVTVAGAAAAGGVLYMFLRRRQQGTTQQAGLIQQTGLIPQPTATTGEIETYYQAMPGVAVTDPTAADLVEARRCFILFIEAYSRYYVHKLPYDLSLMKSMMLKMFSPDFNWITRKDIWAYSDYDWLFRDAEVYYGPPTTYVGRKEELTPVYQLTDRVLGNSVTSPVVSYYTDWDMPLRNIMRYMYNEAEAGAMMRAPRAVLLPFVTRAADLGAASAVVREMRSFWPARGRSVVQSGQVNIHIVVLSADIRTVPIWAVR